MKANEPAPKIPYVPKAAKTSNISYVFLEGGSEELPDSEGPKIQIRVRSNPDGE